VGQGEVGQGEVRQAASIESRYNRHLSQVKRGVISYLELAVPAQYPPN
jgi:hypothetical protein